MKLRLGFVTNSSSTNYVVIWKGQPSNLINILEKYTDDFKEVYKRALNSDFMNEEDSSASVYCFENSLQNNNNDTSVYCFENSLQDMANFINTRGIYFKGEDVSLAVIYVSNLYEWCYDRDNPLDLLMLDAATEMKIEKDDISFYYGII